MSSSNIDTIFTNLQFEQDHSNTLKNLIELRKQVEWPEHKVNITKLRELGAFKQIISILQTSKKGLIDVCLSILGNCCLDNKCARDVVCQFSLFSALNQVLKRYPKEDSVNGRVYRILGNVCQHRDQWANLIIEKKPQILIHCVNFLKSSVEDDQVKISEGTVTMGVRFLREMLNKETLRDLVKTYGALKAVGIVLIKYGKLWEESKQGGNILMNIIKLLQEYSRYSYYPSIQEMRNTDKGDSIVFLSKILLVAPKQVVKIIMNFLKISQLNSDLPVPEIFNSFIEVLRNDVLIQEFSRTCEECVKCLCRLLDHPSNRKNDRCGDSIPILINVLKDLDLDSNNKIECCILIISTFSKGRYSDSLIAEQIKCNILTVLSDKLRSIVGSVEPLNIAHKSDKKRVNLFIKAFKRSKRYRLTVDDDDDAATNIKQENTGNSDEEIDDFYNNVQRWKYSPASSNESEMAASWTSGLSPQSSPRSQVYGILESDSDDYSPVCSEVDNTDFPLSSNIDGTDCFDPDFDKTSEEVSEETEVISNLDSSCFKQTKVKLLIKIVDLLKIYITLQPPVNNLGNPELLLGLIKSSGYFEWPHSSAIVDIADVIYKILEMHDNLLPLMQSNFIPAIYELSKMQHGSGCAKCRQFQWISSSIIKTLSKVAESGVGKGDIAHKLLRGDDATKQQLVLVIPYIVRNKSILMKLMLNCGGLEILMKLLQKESDHQEKSIKVLCVFAAKKLGIPNPKNVEIIPKGANLAQTDLQSNFGENVKFELDDGSLLDANRTLLSQNSDYFGRLLNGDFKESSENVIKLPNVANKSLLCLLDLIKCDVCKNDPMDIDVDINTHLDVIALCDRFLMQDYCVYLTDCVEKFKLSTDTIPIIYNWALESRTNLLRVECIAFALVANVIDSVRFEMFKNLFDLGYNEELVEDIRKLLVRYMTLNQLWESMKNDDFRYSNCENFS